MSCKCGICQECNWAEFHEDEIDWQARAEAAESEVIRLKTLCEQKNSAADKLVDSWANDIKRADEAERRLAKTAAALAVLSEAAQLVCDWSKEQTGFFHPHNTFLNLTNAISDCGNSKTILSGVIANAKAEALDRVLAMDDHEDLSRDAIEEQRDEYRKAGGAA